MKEFTVSVTKDKTKVADSVTELVGALIAGYDTIPFGDMASAEDHDEALGMRYEHAVLMASVIQQGVLSEAANSGSFDPATVDEVTLTALFRDKKVALDVPQWSSELPLVLVRTDYAPFTQRTLPTGTVAFLNPATESEYLSSLHELGLVEVYALSTDEPS